MIPKIELQNFRISHNRVLIKLDPAYDYLVLDGPEGKKIELQLVYHDKTDAVNHFAISGKVLVMPENLFFFNKSRKDISQMEYASSTSETLQVDCDYDFTVGDRIYFNYNVQLNAELERRLLETEEHGICLLVRLESLFGYEKGGEVVPVNGNVFFIRDQNEEEYVTNSNITVIQKVNKYELGTATVISADKPVREYFDGQNEPNVELNKGDRIVVDKRFGYRIAYDTYAGKLEKVEVIQRKNILALLNKRSSELPTIPDGHGLQQA